MVQTATIQEGTRVRILGPESALGVTLGTPFGTVVAPDEYQGYYLVRLDEPATYHHSDGHTEQIDEVREFWGNLGILEPQ
jgi:hypothetical protein